MARRLLSVAGKAALVLAAVLSGLLAAAAIAAPIFEAHRSPFAPPLYALLSLVCHQRPSRSWFLMGSNLGLCARTFSLLGTVALASLAARVRPTAARRLVTGVPLFVAALALVPLVVDGSGQLAGLWTSSNARRAVTGMLAGVALVRLGLVSTRPAGYGRTWPSAPATRRSVAAAVAALLALTWTVPVGRAADSGRVTLRGGTPVFLVFPDSVASESVSEGQSVPLRVLRDVKVGDTVAIASGARASARVTKVQKKAGWGAPGRLEVYVSDVEAVDGQLLPLSARQEAGGEDKGSTAAVTGIVLGVLCLPSALWGFAIKGDEGRIPPGTEVKAFTDAEAYIRRR